MVNRKPIKAEPNPLQRDELWGYRKGQVVKIHNADGKYAKVTGVWKFQYARVDEAGEPVEVTVYGGPKNREQSRSFPIDRLEVPGPKLRKRLDNLNG